jgi:hypothetical protein
MNPDYFDRAPGRPLFGPTAADRLLAGSQSVRLELLRYIDDDDRPAVSCSYKVTGCIEVAHDVPTGELLLGLVQALGAPRPDDHDHGGAK